MITVLIVEKKKKNCWEKISKIYSLYSNKLEKKLDIFNLLYLEKEAFLVKHLLKI